jgi:hypothetical protein
MEWLAYLLMLLLAGVDDAFAVAPASLSAPLADDGDEFLPAQRPPWEDMSSSLQRPMFVSLKQRTPHFLLFRASAASEVNLAAPFAPPPLYVLMSLQI